MKSLKPLALAIPLLATGLGISGNVSATAYSIAYNGVSEGTVDVWQQLPNAAAGTACSLINSGIGGVANCPIGTFVNNFSINPQNVSGAQATLTGTSGAIDSVGPQTGPVDVPLQAVGSAAGGAENNYSAIGITGTNYSRGDSVISSEQTGTLNTASGGVFDTTTASPGITLSSKIAGQNIAEGEIHTNGQATGQGNISSGTSTSIGVSLSTPGQIAFSFDFDPYVVATLAPDAIAGSVARGILSVSVTITPENSSVPAFVWAPDGSAGGILGGVELLDPASLNLVVEQQTIGTSVHDPSGDGIGGTTLNYQAYTNALTAGNYVLTLSMIERVELNKLQAVPEPSLIGLLGVGLVGAGFASRSKRRQKLA